LGRFAPGGTGRFEFSSSSSSNSGAGCPTRGRVTRCASPHHKEESNDDISISKDSKQPSNDAVPPVASGPAALTFRNACQKIAPELQTVEPKGLLTINIDVTTAVTTATGALPEIMALRESASQGPGMAKSVDDRGRDARLARRDEGAYCWYVTEPQPSQPGCIGREGDRLSHSRGRGGFDIKNFDLLETLARPA